MKNKKMITILLTIFIVLITIIITYIKKEDNAYYEMASEENHKYEFNEDLNGDNNIDSIIIYDFVKFYKLTEDANLADAGDFCLHDIDIYINNQIMNEIVDRNSSSFDTINISVEEFDEEYKGKEIVIKTHLAGHPSPINDVYTIYKYNGQSINAIYQITAPSYYRLLEVNVNKNYIIENYVDYAIREYNY